jgi:dienelactone hydrolase
MKVSNFFICVITALFVLAPQAHGDSLTALKPYFNMTKPKGRGPFPVIMMLSGCGGFGFAMSNSRYRTLQRRLTRLGFLVVRVDSLGARSQRTCSNGVVTKNDQAGDVASVVTYLKSLPLIKNDAVNLLGWSWGGGGTLAAAMRLNSFNAAIAYFPSCRNLPGKAVRIPTLVLFGEADNIVSIRACKNIFAASDLLTLRTYPGAHHGFGNPRFNPPVRSRSGTLAYNEAAAKAAWAELEKFLVR